LKNDINKFLPTGKHESAKKAEKNRGRLSFGQSQEDAYCVGEPF
jgi:hypothetical protein